MKSSDQTLLIPQAEGPRVWRSRGAEALRPLAQERRGAVDWVGLSARQVVSLPMRLDGLEPERRTAAASLELEAVGFADQVGSPGQCEIKMLGEAHQRDAAVSCWLQAGQPDPRLTEGALNARFAPASWFRQFQPGVVQMWREDGLWVLGFPDEHGQLLHAQAITARQLDQDAAAELRCLMASLELLGTSARWVELSLYDHPEDVPADFAAGLDLKVVPALLEALELPAGRASGLVPAEVVRGRQQRQQRRMTVLGVLALVLVLVSALGAFALRVWVRDRSVMAQREQLRRQAPELDSIRRTRAAWVDLAPALKPEEYPVESIYQMIQLMPTEGIRVTRFELNSDLFAIDGEATSLGHGVEFRDKLVVAEAFKKKWRWEFPQPTSLGDGRATFRAEGKPADAEPTQTDGEVVAP